MDIEKIKNTVICGDCLEVMRQLPDKYVDLVLTDPPYGINRDGMRKSTGGSHGGRKSYDFAGWDSSIPDKVYFDEIFRVSKNQIIWGGNYFAKYLPSKMCWIVWDKGQRIYNSDGEIAFTSFDTALRIATFNRINLMKDGAFHPTQKPVALFEWCLKKYSKEGDTILDCYAGSGTTAVACIRTRRNYILIEKEPAYVEICKARIKQAETGISVKEQKAGQKALWA